MKITDIRFNMLRVPLKTPFKTALRTVDSIEDVIVQVHTDTGHVGYGEAPATAVITGDTHGSIIEAIRKIIAPRLIGQEIANLNRITRLIQTALEKNSSAKAAVEIAVYDLFGQLYNAPLYKILGGGDPVITTDITISVDYIDKMVADSLAAVDRGFESLKIKVGKDLGLDVERIKAIYAAVEDRALRHPHLHEGGHVQDGLTAFGAAADGIGIAHVPAHDVSRGQAGEVAALAREQAHLVPARGEGAGHVLPEEAGAAGEQDLHATGLRAVTRARQSASRSARVRSRGMRGSQPVAARRREGSPTRTGMSAGRKRPGSCRISTSTPARATSRLSRSPRRTPRPVQML